MAKTTLRRRSALLLPAGALFVTIRRADAAPAAEAVRDVLPNGLVVLVEERRTADTVALQLAARAGSRDDPSAGSGQGLPGINAITSRMLFQGTTRRPSETEVQRAATQVGGTIGRGTGTELSTFSSVMPSDAAALAFELLADLVTDPLLAEGALAR